MASENTLGTPRYDISMSKRTRKPFNFQKEHNPIPLQACSSVKSTSMEVVNEEEDKSTSKICDVQEKDNKKCLKQLIESRNSLGQHFTKEEKQLQLVIKQPEDSLNGLKFKKMVSRYAKVFSHMIKLKRNPQPGYRKKKTGSSTSKVGSLI